MSEATPFSETAGGSTDAASTSPDEAGPGTHETGLSSAPAPGLRILGRLLALARPYAGLIVLVAVFTLVFSGGRFGRAYLMKPLLDGVLLPVATAPVDAAGVTGDTADDWLSATIVRALPDAPQPAGAPADTGTDIRSVRAAFRQLLIAAFVIVLVTPLALFGRAYLTEFVLGRIHVDIQQQMAVKLLGLPLALHQRERSGDLLSRAMNDAGAAREATRLIFQELFLSLTMIVIGLCTLLYLSWPLTLISLMAAPLIVGVLAVFGRRIRHTARRRQAQLGEVTQRLIGILSGIKVIKAFGGEEVESRAFARETHKLFRDDMRVVKNRVLSRSVVEALNSAAGIAMLAIGAVLVLQGRWGLTTGDVAAFATVLATTYKPIKNLAKGWGRLVEHGAAAERFFAVLDAPEEPPDAPCALRLEGIERSIRLEDVGLDHRDPSGGHVRVLEHVSLEVTPGEVIAVVGRTGGGKTTLLDLLMRFRDPTSGSISFDGHDLRDLTRESVGSLVAAVTQDPFLFDTSILENIRYGRHEASDEEVLEAARTAHVDEFVDQLPLGYQTEVGEFGVRLSGGQRQRITIARALLKRPAILIFDEATSALDAKTERTVQDAIESMRGERTIFLVAHRLSTIRRADRIVVLERGTITQVGTHEELIARAGLYSELASLQQSVDAGPKAAGADLSGEAT